MVLDEFEVPKEIKEFFPENAEETFLGNKRGAKNNIDMENYTFWNMMINF